MLAGSHLRLDRTHGHGGVGVVDHLGLGIGLHDQVGAGKAAFTLILAIVLVNRVPVALLGNTIHEVAGPLVVRDPRNAAIERVGHVIAKTFQHVIAHFQRAVGGRKVEPGGRLVFQVFERRVEGPDESGEPLRAGKLVDVIGLGRQLRRTKNNDIIEIFVLDDLIGIGRLQRVLDLARGELAGLVLDAQFIKTLGHRQVVAGPKIRYVGGRIDQGDLQGLLLRAGVLHPRRAGQGLQRFERAILVDLLRQPIVAVAIVRQRFEW